MNETSGQISYKEIDISSDPSMMVKYDVQATPTIVVIDGTGKTTATFTGVPGREELKSAIEEVTSE